MSCRASSPPPPEATAQEILAWALDRFGPDLAVAVSFGAEDMVLLDLLASLVGSHRPWPRLITLDTGLLPAETHALRLRAEEHFGVRFEVHGPTDDEVRALLEDQGPEGFRRSVDARLRCCHVRKVVPLHRALAGCPAWVTGLRRAQSPSRAGISAVEREVPTGPGAAPRWKVNPLAAWSEADVWRHIERRGVPHHALHARRYPSIGCAPCTRPVPAWSPGRDNPGVDLRAGRWWWERAAHGPGDAGTSSSHKECGLHLAPTQPAVSTPSPQRPHTGETP